MLERIIELTAENLGADAATITAETSFKDDLHADSLDLCLHKFMSSRSARLTITPDALSDSSLHLQLL